MKFRPKQSIFRKRVMPTRVLIEAVEPRLLLAGTIRGVAWGDYNANGVRDASEPALPGWTIYLDANHNNQFDAGETSTLTAADGSYAFTGLAAGNYLVGQVTKSGWRQTYPGAAAAAAAAAAPVAGALPAVGPALSTSDAVGAAIARSADLSRYTTAELDAASGWVVGLPAGLKVRTVVSRAGASGAMPGPLAGTYVLTFPKGAAGARVANRLGGAGVNWFYPLVGRQQVSRSTIPNDPLFGQQWYLNNTSPGGADLDVLPAWDQYRGSGVTVAVVDEGVQYTHPDLSANYDAADSYDFNSGDTDPLPNLPGDYHGTMVAGILAAAQNNTKGVSGVAPESRFAALRLTASSTTDDQEAAALAYHRDAIAVYSNSWGPEDDGVHLEGPGPLTIEAMRQSVTGGRGGLGNVYVWAAGNGGQDGDNVNYDGYANSRYVIATTALGANGRQAYYAEPGAPIFVSAFGGDEFSGIATTDLVGSAGQSTSDYYDDFGGTSAATPMVSGIVALMLQANPTLTWRDVKHILAETARRNDPADPGWTRNGAGHWVNHKYGFGLVDARAAVLAAQTWRGTGPETQFGSGTVTVNQVIPDADAITGASSFVYVGTAMRVESVEVVLDASIAQRGDLRVVLTSPDGTQSVLAEPHNDTNENYASWTFTTTHHWDEIAKGTWTLRVTDEQGDQIAGPGVFNSWKLNLYGTAVVGEHYVTVGDGAVVTGLNFGDVPLPGAKVTAANYLFETGAPRVVVTFDRDVLGSVSVDDLELRNDTAGAVVATAALHLDYNAGTRTATWTFPGLTRGVLADGNYTARLKAAGITLPDGGMLDGNGDGLGGDDFTKTFFQLMGDANRDRTVGSADLAAVLANYGKSGAGVGWSTGDFNHNGTVDFGDYQLLESTFRKTLAAPAPAVVVVAAPAPVPVIAVAAPVRVAAARPVTVAARPASVFGTKALLRGEGELLD